MRHKVKRQNIGKDRSHRLSILRNLATTFLLKEKLKSTKTKTRIFRSYIEKIITRAKVDSLHNRRLIFKEIKNTRVIKKLFEDIAKRYLTRPGGYTRIYKLGQRVGDSSEMCIIELVPEFLEESKKELNQENTKVKKKTKTKTEESEGKKSKEKQTH